MPFALHYKIEGLWSAPPRWGTAKIERRRTYMGGECAVRKIVVWTYAKRIVFAGVLWYNQNNGVTGTPTNQRIASYAHNWREHTINSQAKSRAAGFDVCGGRLFP